MSVQSEIERIRTNISGAYSAVSEKGGVLPETQNSGNLAGAIRSIIRAGAAGEPPDPEEVYKAARPADWMALPEPQDNEMYLLVHIPDGLSSLLAFKVTCGGNYTVQLGSVGAGGVFQPSSSASVAGGSAYETQLPASEYGGLTGDGMKQAVVKISGTNILTWDPCVHSRRMAPVNFSGWDIVEIKCRLPQGTAVRCGTMLNGNTMKGRELKRLRFFTWYGSNGAASMSGMFSGCGALVCVPKLNTAGVTDMSNMFSGCAALTAVPCLDTGSAVNMSGMFKGCAALAAVPAMDTSAAEDISNLFSGCTRLAEVPPMDTAEVTNAASVFNGCAALATVPPMNLSKATSAGSLFSGCAALVSVPMLKLAKATAMGSAFYNCSCLSKVRFDSSAAGWAGCAISLSGCGLGHEALVAFLNSLPSITAAKTLTLTGNPGVSELTEQEKAVAAGKNWTLKL